MGDARQSLKFFENQFGVNKDKEITLIFININSLCTEGWWVKNNQIRDFILLSKVDILAFQETNIN